MVFKDKIILVTGAGSIGSAVIKKLIDQGAKQIRCYDISEYSLYRLQNSLSKDVANIRYLLGDIRDRYRLSRAMKDVDLVVHTAALKHVSFCEYNPDEAYKTNVVGSQNVVDLCREHDVQHALLVSTDKAVDPTTVMGTTKLLAEKLFIKAPEYSLQNSTKFTVVRFGNVFGSAGSVVETFYKKIKNHEKIEVSHKEVVRYFMSLQEAASLILNAFPLSSGREIFILKMKKLKILDLAKRIKFLLHQEDILDYEIDGLLPGEKLDEQLFSEHEKQYILEKEKYYIVKPFINDPHYVKNETLPLFQIKQNLMDEKDIDKLILDWLR